LKFYLFAKTKLNDFYIVGEVCCGQYNKDGSYFATASQHGTIDLRKDSNLEEIVETYTSEGKYGLCCRFVSLFIFI
jgi:hypothetical protein